MKRGRWIRYLGRRGGCPLNTAFFAIRRVCRPAGRAVRLTRRPREVPADSQDAEEMGDSAAPPEIPPSSPAPPWTVEKLLEKHASIPFNPDVASVFFRAGHHRGVGQGIERILEACASEVPADSQDAEEKGDSAAPPEMPPSSPALPEAPD